VLVIALPDPADLAAVPVEQLPAVVLQLSALMAAASARLAVVSNMPPAPVADVDGGVLDVHEAARIARRSVSWMRKHGRTVPGFVQPTGHGGRVGWSRRALAAWANGADPAC
jgi:hypothetical protein